VKNTKAILMIGCALALALLAVILASRWIARQGSIGTSKVVVAAVDINLGTRLAPDMLRLADWPSGSVPAGSVADVKALDTRVTRVGLQRGEPLNEAKLAQMGASGGLSAVVAEGKRAMSVRVNDVIGVAGFALPGNFVDILVSTQGEKPGQGGGKEMNISKLVLERILVLAVAQEASQNETKPKVVSAVTLEVTPEQAEQLDLARSVGQLSLVLRNQVDVKSALTPGATKQSLLYAQLAPRAPARPAGERPAPKPKPAPTRADAPAPAPCQQIMTGAGLLSHCD
jgi:pilus assembly protein CpaB